MVGNDLLMFDSFVGKDESYFDLFKSKSALVRASSKHAFFDNHWGSLSIKCTFKGAEEYLVRGRHYKVDQDHFLLINEGTWYSSSIESDEITESFSIFFSPQNVKNCLNAHFTRTELRIDDSYNIICPKPNFIEKLFVPTEAMKLIMYKLKLLSFRFNQSTLQIEEMMHLLFDEILYEQVHTYSEIDSIPSVKKATRLELYRRLNYARDYIQSCYQKNITLNQLSQLAMLSPGYFLRAFKKVYQVTPYQFLIQIRLSRAKELILNNDELSITEISGLVGWEDLPSFSKSFKSYFGHAPIHFRRG